MAVEHRPAVRSIFSMAKLWVNIGKPVDDAEGDTRWDAAKSGRRISRL
jgi:hypothetical protein